MIDTQMMFVRIAEGIALFDTLYGSNFDVTEATALVKKMLTKTVGINGSVENYYGVSNSSMVLNVSDQYDFAAITYLSDATNVGETLKINQYGDAEKIKATVKHEASNSDASYTTGNKTSVKNLNELIINRGSGIKKTFRVTMRAR